jgi:hypothetical protein
MSSDATGCCSAMDVAIAPAVMSKPAKANALAIK